MDLDYCLVDVFCPDTTYISSSPTSRSYSVLHDLPSVSCEVFDEKISTTVNLDLYRATMQHHNNDS